VSRENVELIRRGFETVWVRGDVERAFAGVGPDFEWVVPRHPEGEVRRGPEGAVEFFREWLEPWEEHQIDYELVDLGDDRVLALLHMRARGKGSGAEVEMRVGQVWTVRDGRAVRMVLYFDADEAREAAGLAP
jgi:ketosteroid isomerase-like protein